MRGLALAVLLSTSVPGLAAPAAAESRSAGRAATVPCGDVTELIRQVNQANTVGAGVITLAPGCTYTLTAPAETSGPEGANGLPTVTGQLIIYGSAATITRDSATPFRIAEVATQGSLRLQGITVSGGSATADPGTDGGGILARGRLTLVASAVTGNTASHLGGGIAVTSGATAQLTATTVSGNQASDGGGIHVDTTGRLTVTSGSVKYNNATYTGGGLANFGSTVLSGSTIRDNTTEYFEGGGIYTATGPLTVTGGSIAWNTATTYGGGIANYGSTVLLVGTSVRDNTAGESGGGVFQGMGTFRLVGSPVIGNTPDQCAPPGTVPGCPQ
ncbi:right-handed parallel beta-helix repeat-containing protein [Streptomyces sp. NPDC006332]|uniref:right-handed parallel beta-helix repeat-containing protein n=1 Tax=Streptomyces sp. NPDC006332 TaxID=3155456 RepID=UPI0033AF6715